MQDSDGVESYTKDMIVARLNDVLGENMKTILDLAKVYDELSEALKARVRDDFKKYGLELVDFLIGAITPPEEVQKMIDERAGMAAVGNMNAYMQFKAAKSMEEAAKNTSGGASNGMGLGMGAGMGMMIPGMIGQAMQQAGAAVTAGAGATASNTAILCPACGRPNAPGAKFCDACGKPMQSPWRLAPRAKPRTLLEPNSAAHAGSSWRPHDHLPFLQHRKSCRRQVLQRLWEAHGLTGTIVLRDRKGGRWPPFLSICGRGRLG